ncbi:MAG TPA: YetF domain-containing protein [Vicinamibacterales bacterium]
MGITAYDLSVLAGKTAVVLFVLTALYRLMGKRSLANFTVYDLVTVMAVANAVQNAMTAGRGEVLVGIGCSATLLLLAFASSRAFTSSPAAERVVLGEPVLLIHGGRVLADRLRQEHITRGQLLEALRAYGLSAPAEVKMAVLEIDGSISVVPKDVAGRG